MPGRAATVPRIRVERGGRAGRRHWRPARMVRTVPHAGPPSRAGLRSDRAQDGARSGVWLAAGGGDRWRLPWRGVGPGRVHRAHPPCASRTARIWLCVFVREQYGTAACTCICPGEDVCKRWERTRVPAPAPAAAGRGSLRRRRSVDLRECGEVSRLRRICRLMAVCRQCGPRLVLGCGSGPLARVGPLPLRGSRGLEGSPPRGCPD
jgi:hypothetical protein